MILPQTDPAGTAKSRPVTLFQYLSWQTFLYSAGRYQCWTAGFQPILRHMPGTRRSKKCPAGQLAVTVLAKSSLLATRKNNSKSAALLTPASGSPSAALSSPDPGSVSEVPLMPVPDPLSERFDLRRRQRRDPQRGLWQQPLSYLSFTSYVHFFLSCI